MSGAIVVVHRDQRLTIARRRLQRELGASRSLERSQEPHHIAQVIDLWARSPQLELHDRSPRKIAPQILSGPRVEVRRTGRQSEQLQRHLAHPGRAAAPESLHHIARELHVVLACHPQCERPRLRPRVFLAGVLAHEREPETDHEQHPDHPHADRRHRALRIRENYRAGVRAGKHLALRIAYLRAVDTRLDIGIIGCGTAGAAAALFCARAGHRVTVYEAVRDPHPVGAGITLQPTGMGVLSELGLLARILERGARIDHLHCVTQRSRRTVLDLRYDALDPRVFGLGVHRGLLFTTLFQAVRSEPRIHLRLGQPVEGIRSRAKKRHLVDRSGREIGDHHLVIVADGARSQLRDDVVLARRERQYPWGCLWFIGDDPQGEFDNTLFQIVDGSTTMMGLLPSGLGPSGDTKKVSLFWSIRADRVEAWREAGFETWKDHLATIEPRARPLLDQVQHIDQVLFARYWDIVMPRWHAPGVVFLGDAAHATSPQLGQGANLALVDAMALSRALEAARDLPEALRAYSDLRRSHLRYYQWATRFLTPFFQSDLPFLAAFRDTFMGPACRVPYIRKRMVSTMCGLDRGILWSERMQMPEHLESA